jgi:hypothetical protein
MIELPKFSDSFEFENNFYLTCDSSRLGKLLADYEIFKMTNNLNGAIVECGVYKGASLSRFAMLRDLFGGLSGQKNIVAFDSFSSFPETEFADDKPLRQKFIDIAGAESISREQLFQVLQNKNCHNNLELIEGDICETVPKYADENKKFKISLLNLDVDIYEPAVAILEYFYPMIESGGVLILDDYGSFPGETKAVDDYFSQESIEIRKFQFCKTIHYIIKP